MHDPHNEKRDPALFALIAEYERSSRSGMSFFLDESAYAQLLDYYEDEEQFEKALEVADAAIQQYGYSTDFYLRKAQILLHTNREAVALDVLDQALIYAPGDLDVTLLRTEALTYLQRYDEAISSLEHLRTVAEGEDLSDVLLIESLIYEQRQQYDLMFTALRAALRSNPRNQDALERIWLCTEFCGNHLEAVELHTWVIDQDPYSYLAWHNLGHSQVALGQADEALEAYEYAFITNPDFPDAYYDFAALCYECQRYRQALQVYQEIVERFPPDADLWLNVGLCYQNLLDYPQARAALEHAIRLNPHDDEAYFQLGECHVAEENWTGALRCFTRASKLNPQQPEYLSALGEAAYQLLDYPKAEAAFLQAIDLSKEIGQYWLDYGRFLLETDRPHQLVTLMDEALTYTDAEECRYAAVVGLLCSGQRQAGLQQLGQLLASSPQLPEWLTEWWPDLRHDSEVSMLLALYRAG